MIGVLLTMVSLFPAAAAERSCIDELSRPSKTETECKLIFFVNDFPADPEWVIRARCGDNRKTLGILITNELYDKLTLENAKSLLSVHSNLYESEIDMILAREKTIGPSCVDKDFVAITINE